MRTFARASSCQLHGLERVVVYVPYWELIKDMVYGPNFVVNSFREVWGNPLKPAEAVVPSRPKYVPCELR